MKRFNGNIAGRLCRPVCIFHPERVSQGYCGKTAACIGLSTGIPFRAERGESAVRRFAGRNPVSRGARGIRRVRRFTDRNPVSRGARGIRRASVRRQESCFARSERNPPCIGLPTEILFRAECGESAAFADARRENRELAQTVRKSQTGRKKRDKL